MAIDRQKGAIGFICDGDRCGVFVTNGDGDFSALLATAKDEGWLTGKRDGDGKWQHFCKDCKGEANEKKHRGGYFRRR